MVIFIISFSLSIKYLKSHIIFSIDLPIYLHNSIGMDVLTGVLSTKILRPYSIWLSYFWEEIGYGLITNTFGFCILLIVAWIGKSYIMIQTDMFLICTTGISVILGYGVSIMISYCLGWLSFFVVNNKGISEFLLQIHLFTSGRIIPLQTISYFSPLVFLAPASSFYIPIQIYLGAFDRYQVIFFLGLQLSWIWVLYLIADKIYHSGLKKYESVGL
jgi:ABC-2 type transport system permease protein